MRAVATTPCIAGLPPAIVSGMTWRALVVALCVGITLRAQPASRPVRAALDVRALAVDVDATLAGHGDGVAASLWLGGAEADAWFARDVETPRATASAIKTFYLVELYARFAGALDRPLPGVDGALADDAHPAIAHFTPEQRAEVRRELSGATVRHVGQVMMGSAPASNIVYNAAANLVTVAFGGPEALTAAIHRRDPAFSAVAARRYMLRNRRERGDNEAPARALAVLYQRLASRHLAGIDAASMDALHEALRRRDDPLLGRHYDKGGDLDSDPLTMVRAGWYDTAKGPLVYVAMTMQPVPGPAGRPASTAKLGKTADALAITLVKAGWTSLTSSAR
jgi:hypothetical protein